MLGHTTNGDRIKQRVVAPPRGFFVSKNSVPFCLSPFLVVFLHLAFVFLRFSLFISDSHCLSPLLVIFLRFYLPFSVYLCLSPFPFAFSVARRISPFPFVFSVSRRMFPFPFVFSVSRRISQFLFAVIRFYLSFFVSLCLSPFLFPSILQMNTKYSISHFLKIHRETGSCLFLICNTSQFVFSLSTIFSSPFLQITFLQLVLFFKVSGKGSTFPSMRKYGTTQANFQDP